MGISRLKSIEENSIWIHGLIHGLFMLIQLLLDEAGADALNRLATAIATGGFTNASLLLLGAEIAGSLAGGRAIPGETGQLMPSEYIDALKGAATVTAGEGPGGVVGGSVSDQVAPPFEAFRAQRAGML